MILLKPGYDISIHSCHGAMLDNVIVNLSNREFAAGLTYVAPSWVWSTVRPATALFLVPGIYSAIENSANGGSYYLVSCKFLQKIVL